MNLKNPVISLDIETTGVWVEKDKIIEIALVKYHPDGKKEILHKKINPGIPIPAAVTELTGISNQDVKDAPFFKDAAKEIFAFFGHADFAGFNVERFDLPLLQRELWDAGIKFEWKDRIIYDAQKVYHLNEKRDLSAAYQFYCGKELNNAHSALADAEAAYEILGQQVVKYGKGVKDISVLEQFDYVQRSDSYDSEGKFCWWNGKLYPTFGKYFRKLSLDEIAKKDVSYLNWLITSDFKDDVKELAKMALKGEIPVRK